MTSDPNQNRSTLPQESAFTEYIRQSWGETPARAVKELRVAKYARARRERVLEEFGQFLVFYAGVPKIKSHDLQYPFRPGSNFTWLSGWGAEAVPGSVLVLHRQNPALATLFFPAPADKNSREFYANPRIGEFWVGARPGLGEIAQLLGLEVLDISRLREFLANEDRIEIPADLENLDSEQTRLATRLSELRMIKDDFEIAEIKKAIDLTHSGFSEALKALDKAQTVRRGERYIEGVFNAYSRLEGNGVGYASIVAAGEHATVLHWNDNDGGVRDGELLLLDAGVEVESLYTADITRTLPVGGRFSPEQRMVYQAVLEAADAAFARVRPGVKFYEIHRAAIEVIAKYAALWGLIPLSAEQSLKPKNQHHRRYMIHGASHHLGLDVHDCGRAPAEAYKLGTLKPGMVFTIEPGLYFHSNDLTVPERFRGLGVRIEDNILVTQDGAENLSRRIPRKLGEVEDWVRKES